MPDLEHTYLDHDLALLRAIAMQAGVELTAPNARAAAAELAAALRDPETVDLLLAHAIGQPDNSPSEESETGARSALNALLRAGGRFAVAPFARRFGEPRPLGPGALSRERPWENPVNATEALYFNGLIGRAFMDSEAGPQEYFFLPDDLIPNLPPPPEQPTGSIGELIPTTAPDEARPASSALVDDAVTVLAATQKWGGLSSPPQRAGKPATTRQPGRAPRADELAPFLRLPAFEFVSALLVDLQLITPGGKLDRDHVKPFLSASRADQLRTLAEAWRDSKSWNDLLHVPSLHAEPGAWHNDPLTARALIIRLCADLPSGEWKSVDAFVAFVREHHADFQRPAGDYDSWYIRDSASGDYLRGFEHWDQVDGALVRYLIAGPMHWLGLTDVSSDGFRLTPIFSALVGRSEWNIPEKQKSIALKTDGTLVVHRAANRFDRFQAARIGEWLTPKEKDTYEYRLSGSSLQAASAQGITAKHVLAFLRRACEQPAPQLVMDAVERWGKNGIEARASRPTILRVGSAELLDLLRRSPKTKHYLGETLGDLIVEVKNWEKLREGMLELGIVGEFVNG